MDIYDKDSMSRHLGSIFCFASIVCLFVICMSLGLEILNNFACQYVTVSLYLSVYMSQSQGILDLLIFIQVFFYRDVFSNLLILCTKNKNFPSTKSVLDRLVWDILKTKCSLQKVNYKNYENSCCCWGFVFGILASNLQ